MAHGEGAGSSHMFSIKVDNSYCQISGQTPAEERKLKELLSFAIGSNAAYYAGAHRPQRRSLLDRRGSFPTGLLSKVLIEFPTVKIVDNRVRPQSTPGMFKLK